MKVWGGGQVWARGYWKPRWRASKQRIHEIIFQPSQHHTIGSVASGAMTGIGNQPSDR